ncbi:Crp/Fnr family transcriptional regulator [Mangrovibacterium lignilyticum]|uniref:Crp/Fnr family transcriptional regulator n=1 Tax=Mangrovibacterium lignilyticum TaxID=2668052 RepID=UPI0013D5C3E9|nr:Crp/Fnr family transcriptional regulator [Mangrovibacterium lignilyticum]
MINLISIADFLRQFGDFENNDLIYIASKIEEFDLKAETCHLQSPVPACRINYLVGGIIGTFCIDTDGNECLRHFIPEKHFFTDPDGFLPGRYATYTFRALTDCQVLSMSATNVLALIAEIPNLEKFYRNIREQSLLDLLKSYEFVRTGTAAEQYQRLLICHPEIIRSVWYKHTADFLGITPQSLSRIRHFRQ